MYGNQPIKTEMQIQWPIDLKEIWVATPELVFSCFLQGGTFLTTCDSWAESERMIQGLSNISTQSDQMWWRMTTFLDSLDCNTHKFVFLSEYAKPTTAMMLSICQFRFCVLSHLHFYLTFPEYSTTLT